MTTYTTTQNNTVVRVDRSIENNLVITRKFQFAFGTWVMFMKSTEPFHL